jgi:hypothetical protein
VRLDLHRYNGDAGREALDHRHRQELHVAAESREGQCDQDETGEQTHGEYSLDAELVDDRQILEEFLELIEPALREGLVTFEKMHIRMYRAARQEG